MAREGRRVTPLRVTACVPQQIAIPRGGIALDALLASQVAMRIGLPPPASAADCVPIKIPVAVSECGRFHLASFSLGELHEFDVRFVNRRAPIEQYQTLGPRTGRVQITAGPDKSYRIPLETGHVQGEVLLWYCVGQADEIRELLTTVTHLGKKRGVGLGRVESWDVSQCEPWGEGFPVARDGNPLRPLPPDWPGLTTVASEYRVLGCVSGPYWDHAREELCAVPA